MNELAQLGAAGLLVLIILREVFGFLKNRKNGYSAQDWRVVKAQVDDLHKWHNVDHPQHPGSKAWYTTEVEATMDRLVEGNKEHTLLLRKILDAIRENNGKRKKE